MDAELKNIFESYTLNRKNLMELPIYTASCSDNRLFNIRDSERFNASFSKILKGKFGDENSSDGLLRSVRRTLIECEELCDSNIEARVQSFKSNLSKMDSEDHSIFKKFSGVTISSSIDPVSLGSIFLYELPRHDKEFSARFKFAKPSHLLGRSQSHVFIESVVSAKDEIKALEIANSRFNSIDLLTCFFLGDRCLNFSFGILRFHFNLKHNALISHEGGLSLEEEGELTTGDLIDVSKLLCDDSFGDNKSKRSRLIECVLSPKSLMEKRIKNAIEWLGEAYVDSNRSSSYLKSIIGLESLLKMDEKGVINSSIMSSIAEFCAYLQGRSMDDCLIIEQKVKELYGERSKIAHTGASSVSLKNLNEAREFVRDIVLSFVKFVDDREIKTIEDLRSNFRNIKYQNFLGC